MAVKSYINRYLFFFFSVKVVRMRWKSLRDSYVKEIKYKMAVSTGHNVKPRKNWRYSNCMTFLAPYLAISFPLPPNKTSPEDTKEELGDHEHEPEQSFSMNMNSSNEDEANGHFLGALLDFSKHDNSEKGDISSRQEYVTSSTNTPNKSEDSDVDAFFKGISETVKKMNVVNQVFIQRNIVNMILDFKLREAQEKYIIQQRVADDND